MSYNIKERSLEQLKQDAQWYEVKRKRVQYDYSKFRTLIDLQVRNSDRKSEIGRIVPQIIALLDETEKGLIERMSQAQKEVYLQISTVLQNELESNHPGSK